jgi:hypothetical protein
VLPELFDVRDVRPRAARDRVLPMSVRRVPVPAGAGGS